MAHVSCLDSRVRFGVSRFGCVYPEKEVERGEKDNPGGRGGGAGLVFLRSVAPSCPCPRWRLLCRVVWHPLPGVALRLWGRLGCGVLAGLWGRCLYFQGLKEFLWLVVRATFLALRCRDWTGMELRLCSLASYPALPFSSIRFAVRAE